MIQTESRVSQTKYIPKRNATPCVPMRKHVFNLQLVRRHLTKETVICIILISAHSKILKRKSIIFTNHLSKIKSNASSIGHKENIGISATTLLDGHHQRLEEIVPTMLTSSARKQEKVMENVQSKVCSRRISTDGQDGGTTSLNTTVVLVERVERRRQLRSLKNGTNVIMVITI